MTIEELREAIKSNGEKIGLLKKEFTKSTEEKEKQKTQAEIDSLVAENKKLGKELQSLMQQQKDPQDTKQGKKKETIKVIVRSLTGAPFRRFGVTYPVQAGEFEVTEQEFESLKHDRWLEAVAVKD